MSREIKTRENYKEIKVLDKSIHRMKRMRQASMRAKESNPQEQMQEQERHAQSPVAYAEDNLDMTVPSELPIVELDKELPKGRHECTIEIQYAVEGHVATIFPIVIDVE